MVWIKFIFLFRILQGYIASFFFLFLLVLSAWEVSKSTFLKISVTPLHLSHRHLMLQKFIGRFGELSWNLMFPFHYFTTFLQQLPPSCRYRGAVVFDERGYQWRPHVDMNRECTGQRTALLSGTAVVTVARHSHSSSRYHFTGPFPSIPSVPFIPSSSHSFFISHI